MFKKKYRVSGNDYREKKLGFSLVPNFNKNNYAKFEFDRTITTYRAHP